MHKFPYVVKYPEKAPVIIPENSVNMYIFKQCFQSLIGGIRLLIEWIRHRLNPFVFHVLPCLDIPPKPSFSAA